MKRSKVPNEKSCVAQELKRASSLLFAVRQSLTPGPASVPGYKPLTLLQILDNLRQVQEVIDDLSGY